MGKGDKRSKKGKRRRGSHGKSRPTKRRIAAVKRKATGAAPKKKAAKKAAPKKSAKKKKA